MPQLAILMLCGLAALYLVGRALINQLQKVLIPMSDALNRLTTSVGGLIDQLASNDTELSAIAAELRSASPSDTAALNALADRLDTAAAAAKTAGDAVKDVLPPPAPAPVVTFSPTTISGTGPQTGNFAGDGGAGPYSFSAKDDGGGAISLNADGSYTANQSGTAVVVATDANGIASADTTVSISIST